ncbi:uncharacterized protein [Dermacentor albipictus]|uniref:uncharacterized protein isoform X2 n=1 Tax=Dermacentor albipictus TaxID=60249 RepID=UPI0038FCF2E0
MADRTKSGSGSIASQNLRSQRRRDVLLKAPCSTTTGGGDEYGRTTVPGQPQWSYPSGEDGDVEANQSQAESGLAPAWSLPSLDVRCTVDIFPWEGDEAEPSPPPLSIEMSTSTTSVVSPSSGEQEGDDEDDEQPMARVLDVSGQRADFRTTPSAASLLSDFVFQGYQSLRSSEHLSSRSSGSSYGPITSASPTPPQTHVRVLHDAFLLSTNKFLEQWLESPLEPRIEPRRRPTWARLWAGLRGNLEQMVKCFRDRAGRRHLAGRNLGRRRRDASRAGRELCSDGQGEGSGHNMDEVFTNVSSDDFYMAGAWCWHVRRIYQRCVAYLHALWCWRGP